MYNLDRLISINDQC